MIAPQTTRGFQIKYYRDKLWAERWEAAGVYKPEGYTTSTAQPMAENHAKAIAAHINTFNPTYPCLVVRV